MENEVLDNNLNTFGNDPAPKPLPNADAILVLGIVSIVGCFCYGILGIICGIVALVMASTASNLYNLKPEQYTISSYKNMQAGKICAIVGLAISALYFIIAIGMLIFGIATDPYMFDGF